MTIRLGVIMDPIASIHYQKDSTLAMLWEAQERQYELYYFEQKDLFLRDGNPYGTARRLNVFHHQTKWFQLQDAKNIPLADLDVILMRKDPPFNEQYIYTTYILEHAERLGVFVVNKPQALRDANEKFYATYFPSCCPPTLVTQSISKLREFWLEQKDIVCKPLNTMGGDSVFRLQENDVNALVVFTALTKNETTSVMAQKFIPEIKDGDKRIIMIDGNPIPYALARVPQNGDWRGNLAVGAKGKIAALTKRDLFICHEVGKSLHKNGLYFVGLDVIGDYLTEINVTSPTGIRELDEACSLNISAELMDCIERYLRK